jgi:hypothetical protein
MIADREIRVIAPTAAETEFLRDEAAKLFPSCFKSRVEGNTVRPGYRAYVTLFIDSQGSEGK